MADTAGGEELLENAVATVLSKDFVKNPSPESQGAVETATALLEWIKVPANRVLFGTFSLELIHSLQQCFKCYGRSRLVRKKQEKMWGAFHETRTSSSFIKGWEDFLCNVKVSHSHSPIFYQHITDIVFQKLVKMEHPCGAEQDASATGMSEMEESALRYVAGYVLRQLKSTLQKSKNPQKENFLFCINEMTGGDEMDVRGTAQWINNIDRGGLCHVNDKTYTCFCLMEGLIREHLMVTKICEMVSGVKETMIEEITSSDDVTMQWSVALGTSSNDAHTTELLRMAVTLYITVRGFAFTKSCLELYKQATRRSLAKSKGIRKQLFTPNV